MTKLTEIQQKLKAPKSQTNDFGKYKYRSCEDILSKVKPMLGSATLTLADDMIMLGDRYYIKATATISDGKESRSVSAFAREDETKKGMDLAQLTGSCSSYARKYALNGLFLLDDTKEIDGMDNKQPPQAQKQPTTPPGPETPPTEAEIAKNLAIREMRDCKAKDPVLFGIISENLKHKEGFKPVDLTLDQCQNFIDKFIERMPK